MGVGLLAHGLVRPSRGATPAYVKSGECGIARARPSSFRRTLRLYFDGSTEEAVMTETVKVTVTLTMSSAELADPISQVEISRLKRRRFRPKFQLAD